MSNISLKKGTKIGTTLLGVVFISNIMFHFLQKQIVFHPKVLTKDYVFKFDAPFEELFLETADSITLNALYFKTEKESSKGVILYFHGNSDNLQRWGQFATDFTSKGYDFFAMDYRGFGKSEGKIEEHKFYEDAHFVYNWLKDQYESNQIIIYGRSLGSSVASNLAADVKARMLILETPFDNLKGAIAHRKFSINIPFKLDYEFANDRYLPYIKYPIYIFQGTKDKIVPYQSALQLKPLLKENDIFFTIDDGKHKNLNTFAAYHQYLSEILK